MAWSSLISSHGRKWRGGGMREGNLEWQVEEGTVSPI